MHVTVAWIIMRDVRCSINWSNKETQTQLSRGELIKMW